MGVGDGAAQAAPQPRDAVGVRVIGRGVDQHQLLAQLGEQGAQQPRPFGGVDAEVVQDHHGDLAAGLGACHGAAQLGAQRGGAAAVGQRPSRCPSRQSTSPKPYCVKFCRAPGPAADRAGRRATTPGSGSGGGRPRPRLAGTDPRGRAAPADRAGPRVTAHRPGWHRGQDRMPVEALVRPRPRAVPPPSAVFCPARLGLGLALQRPAGPLAHIAGAMQRSLTVSIPARCPVSAAR